MTEGGGTYITKIKEKTNNNFFSESQFFVCFATKKKLGGVKE